MRLPVAARAKMNTESPGAACAANAGSSVTVPVTLVPVVALVALAGGRAAASGVAGGDAAPPEPSFSRASAIIDCTRGASSLPGGSWSEIFCQ